MPLIGFPIGLAGLLALPLLAAIYLLRRRHRRVPVSALFLWDRVQPPRQGGTRMDPTRWPWIILLEMAILALLAMAASDPMVTRRDGRRELVVVLDATVSMTAPGADGTPALEAALRTLRRIFRSEPWRRIRVIEARSVPATRVDAVDAAQAVAQLAGFVPRAPGTEITPAMALATRLAGPADALLVLSDRPPATPIGDARLRWIAIGQAVPNMAIIDALRGPDADGRDTGLLEIANYSPAAQDVALFLEHERSSRQVARFMAAPGERRRVRVPMPPGGEPVRLRLEPADDFMLDNQVVLCPAPDTPVRVAVATAADAPHTDLLRRALAASGRVVTVRPDTEQPSAAPALTIRDAGEHSAAAAPWTLLWHQPADARPVAGPFLRGPWHPLTGEVMLDGVVWGAQRGYKLPGQALISAADGTPLIAIDDGPVVHLHWVPAQSTLQRTPDWPILVDGLIDWRTAAMPAGQPRNLPLGARMSWPIDGQQTISVRTPNGETRRLPVRDGMAVFEPETVGAHRITVAPDGDTFELAVNLLSAAGSDLRGRDAGEWGDRISPAGRAASRVPIAWLLLLGAVSLCALHVPVSQRGMRS